MEICQFNIGDLGTGEELRCRWRDLTESQRLLVIDGHSVLLQIDKVILGNLFSEVQPDIFIGKGFSFDHYDYYSRVAEEYLQDFNLAIKKKLK